MARSLLSLFALDFGGEEGRFLGEVGIGEEPLICSLCEEVLLRTEERDPVLSLAGEEEDAGFVVLFCPLRLGEA